MFDDTVEDGSFVVAKKSPLIKVKTKVAKTKSNLAQPSQKSSNRITPRRAVVEKASSLAISYIDEYESDSDRFIPLKKGEILPDPVKKKAGRRPSTSSTKTKSVVKKEVSSSSSQEKEEKELTKIKEICPAVS